MSQVCLYQRCLLGAVRLIKVLVKEQNMDINLFWLDVARLTYISNYFNCTVSVTECPNSAKRLISL